MGLFDGYKYRSEEEYIRLKQKVIIVDFLRMMENKNYLIVIGILFFLSGVGLNIRVRNQYKIDLANTYKLKLIRLNNMCAMIAE